MAGYVEGRQTGWFACLPKDVGSSGHGWFGRSDWPSGLEYGAATSRDESASLAWVGESAPIAAAHLLGTALSSGADRSSSTSSAVMKRLSMFKSLTAICIGSVALCAVLPAPL